MKIVRITILALTLMSATNTVSAAWYDNFNTKTVLYGSVAALGGYTLFQFGYNQVQQYIKNKIINDSVDAIVIALTPNTFLNDTEIRKKGQLIAMRKRIILTLEGELPRLSPNHREMLAKQLGMVKFALFYIDATRTENPYEKEYAIATAYDRWVESNMVKSIMLKTKPYAECTPQERAQKEEMLGRSAIIQKKVQDRLKGKVTAVINAVLPIVIFIMTKR